MATLEDHLLALFDLYDIDDDGRISRADIDGMRSRVCDAFGLLPDSSKAQVLAFYYEQTWAELLILDTDGDGFVTREEYVAAAKATPLATAGSKTSGEVEQQLRCGLSAEFHAADRDDDGVVTRAEFVLLFRAFGVSEADAETAFERVDRNADNGITLDEYGTAWLRVITEPDAQTLLSQP